MGKAFNIRVTFSIQTQEDIIFSSVWTHSSVATTRASIPIGSKSITNRPCPCITEQQIIHHSLCRYVSNTQCCMEFQHAKVSLKKPVIPLVVGDGSFKWMTSVVGMLIAGELFIHYRDTEVESAKNAELLTNVRHHIPEVNIALVLLRSLFIIVIQKYSLTEMLTFPQMLEFIFVR